MDAASKNKDKVISGVKSVSCCSPPLLAVPCAMMLFGAFPFARALAADARFLWFDTGRRQGRHQPEPAGHHCQDGEPGCMLIPLPLCNRRRFLKLFWCVRPAAARRRPDRQGEAQVLPEQGPGPRDSSARCGRNLGRARGRARRRACHDRRPGRARAACSGLDCRGPVKPVKQPTASHGLHWTQQSTSTVNSTPDGASRVSPDSCDPARGNGGLQPCRHRPPY